MLNILHKAFNIIPQLLTKNKTTGNTFNVVMSKGCTVLNETVLTFNVGIEYQRQDCVALKAHNSNLQIN